MRPPKMAKEFVAHLSRVYGEKAEIYEKMSRCEDYRNDILKRVLKDVDFRNKTVLDLGAGTGRFSMPLSRKARLVYALDQSRPMLRVLRRKIKAKRIRNIRILESGYGKIALPNRSVDIVFSAWSFPAHSVNWEKDLREVKRVLKKGGKIIFVDNYHGGEYWKIKKKVMKSFLKSDKFNRARHAWLLSKGFRYRVVNTLTEFGSKRAVEQACGPFFGLDIAVYLLARNRTSFVLPVSIFYGKK